MHLSAAITGADPGDIRGNSAGFADFCRQFLFLDGGIGPLLHFRGEIHGERPPGICNIAAILKMKDPDLENGFQNGFGEIKKL